VSERQDLLPTPSAKRNETKHEYRQLDIAGMMVGTEIEVARTIEAWRCNEEEG
jgi:hypothetical protein